MIRVRTVTLIVIAIWLTACAAASSLPAREATSDPIHQPAAAAESATPASAPESLIHAIARQLGISPELFKILWIQKVEWLNACLGLPVQDDACAPVLTPGFGGMLEADGQRYEFRSDETGRVLHLIPGAVLASRQVLAEQLHFNHPDAIDIVSVEQAEWPDACPGVHTEAAACAQAVTPGYCVVFQVNGERYTYHTDQAGSQVVLATHMCLRPTKNWASCCWQIAQTSTATDLPICSRRWIGNWRTLVGIVVGLFTELRK